MSSLVERWCRVHGRGGSPQHLRRAALRLLSVVCTFVVFCAGDGDTMRVQQPWAGVRDERLMPTSRQPSRRDFSSLPRLRGGGFVYEQSLNFSAFRLAWPNASIYSCANCGVHISSTSHVMSKKFQGQSSRAYMMRKVVNCYLGPREDRVLKTGLHTVADIHCRNCDALLGWKYLGVLDMNQRVKVNKFILEKAFITKVSAQFKPPDTCAGIHRPVGVAARDGDDDLHLGVEDPDDDGV